MPVHLYTRRAIVANLVRAAASTAVGIPSLNALAQSFGGPNQRRGGLMQYAEEFRRQFRVPAMSIALSKNGRFVFDHAGGIARLSSFRVQVTFQNSLFRIADLSKPITAVTIFSLIEAGKLNLADKVFGSAGALPTSNIAKPPYKTYVADITVDHTFCHAHRR